MPEKRRSVPAVLLALLIAGLLAGCASATVTPPGELRVIVRFGRSVSAADPEWLNRLSALTGTSVRLSSMVSDTEAAYWLKCAAKDPNCNEAMGRMMTVPGVIGLQPDRYRYPTDPPR